MQKDRENRQDEVWDVVVIGGGPAGMMAAGRAAERGAKTLLVEKNPSLGKKLNITGGGRCNITNAEFDIRTLLKNFSEAEQFLYSPFSQFGVQDTFDFFEKFGLPLVVEARKRAFPNTQNAHDVTHALKKYIFDTGVKVRTNSPVLSLKYEKGIISEVVCKEKTYKTRNVIIATGGNSHPETGSTGDAFVWLKNLGHTIKPSSPTIVPLRASDSWIKSLSGKSLSFMKIGFFVNNKKAFSKVGKLLFTHFGLSGPLILNSAYKVGELLEEGDVLAKIDMYPDTDFKTLERQIINKIDENKNKDFINLLDDIVPHGLDKTIFSMLEFSDPRIKSHSVGKVARKKLVHILKGVEVNISGLMGYDRAVVSDGGVVLGEIDTRTMRSKLFPNLYCTGDVLHINRPSGGYSLQLCWTTGYVAGNSVVF